MMKKLPELTPLVKRQKDDPLTTRLKKIISRGLGYTLVGVRSLGEYHFLKNLYPESCHETIHQVIDIMVANQLGYSADMEKNLRSYCQHCQYRRELTGGKYDRLKDIQSASILGGVLYQMVSCQRFGEDFSGVEVFSAIPKVVDDIVELLMKEQNCRRVKSWPLPTALEEMKTFPTLWLTDETIWVISNRKTGFKRIDFFYPIVAYFLAQQHARSSPHRYVGVISPYKGQYSKLDMAHFSPTTYREVQTLMTELS